MSIEKGQITSLRRVLIRIRDSYCPNQHTCDSPACRDIPQLAADALREDARSRLKA
jgi:hypothetical protein